MKEEEPTESTSKEERRKVSNEKTLFKKVRTNRIYIIRRKK